MRVTKTQTITVTGVLAVSVTAEPKKGYIGKTFNSAVNWSPVSGAPALIDIDYGDGVKESKSVLGPPAWFSHKYATPKTYTVRATVRDAMTGSVGSGSTSIVVADPLVVSFNASPKTGDIPLNVAFAGGITKGFTPYSWTLDFKNGTTPISGTATSFTISHTYSKVGTFTATLTVTDALGATAVKSVNITTGAVSALERFKAWWDSLAGWQKALVILLGVGGGAAGGYKLTR